MDDFQDPLKAQQSQGVSEGEGKQQKFDLYAGPRQEPGQRRGREKPRRRYFGQKSSVELKPCIEGAAGVGGQRQMENI